MITILDRTSRYQHSPSWDTKQHLYLSLGCRSQWWHRGRATALPMFLTTCGWAAAPPFLASEWQRHLSPRIRELAWGLGGAKASWKGWCGVRPMAQGSSNQGAGKSEYHPFCHLLHVFSQGTPGWWWDQRSFHQAGPNWQNHGQFATYILGKFQSWQVCMLGRVPKPQNT